MKLSGTHRYFIFPVSGPDPSATKVDFAGFDPWTLLWSRLMSLDTQTLDYWKNQTSSPVLLIQYFLILVWLYGDLSVLGLYKLCCYLCMSIFIDCSFPVQMF